MIIYVLHDLRQPDSTWVACMEELKRQGIERYIMYPAIINGLTVEQCINRSHKSIVAEAKHKNLPEVCIMESDVMFPAIDGWEYFLRDMPQAFDIHLAGVYSNSMDKFRTTSLFTHHHTVSNISGFHCYIVKSRYYDKFLEVPDDLHIDDAQQGGIYSVCYPFAAIQRPGWSANAKAKVDYNTGLIPQDVYGW